MVWPFGGNGSPEQGSSTLGTMLRMMGMGDVVPLIESGDFARNVQSFVAWAQALDARTRRIEAMLGELLRRAEANRVPAVNSADPAGADNGGIGAGSTAVASLDPISRASPPRRRAGNGAAAAPAAPQ